MVDFVGTISRSLKAENVFKQQNKWTMDTTLFSRERAGGNGNKAPVL